MALPLWIGTLDDVDDLLPQITALFDLVILDEASSIDQPLASTTLLRGRRGVVVGDPRQLRHVSFVSDERVQDAIGRSGQADDTALASRLDVRRNSAFDVAAGSAPVIHLDEHFRGDPHLIEFVATRLYDGRLHVATRSPMTDSKDCIEIRVIDGDRDREGVVTAEVTAVVAEVRRLLGFGQRSVGVVTPFRAQADALEAALLAAFTTDELVSLDLRVGTVHEFQGIERDVIVGSLGIGPAEPLGTWTFVQDRHLLAVFLTRARRRMIFVRSADPPLGGLLASYLRQVDEPPGPPKSGSVASTWVASVAQGLSDASLSPLLAYPAGRHVVDIAAGGDAAAYAIDCRVHPDGPVAHLDRNLSLLRAGWRIVDAFESRWGERRAELAIELAAILRR